MTIVEKDSRWFLWGLVRIATGDRRTGRQGREEVLLLPEPTRETKGRKPHFTDWVEEHRVEKYGTLLAVGEEAPNVKTKKNAVTAAVEAARSKVVKVVTPERRLANRITSARYRMKNPEKSGRSEWTAAELQDLQDTIDSAVAELAALKGAS